MVTMEDKVDTRAHDAHELSQESAPPRARDTMQANQLEIACHVVAAQRVTARGRQLRKWLIIGNIVTWALVFLAVRASFF